MSACLARLARHQIRWCLAFCTILVALPVSARSRGIVASGCDGCHNGPNPVSLSLTPAATPSPGQELTFTLVINSPNVRAGGVYVTTEGVGQFRALPGESLAVVGPDLIHTSPRTAASGQVSFQFAWRAPEQPGRVRFGVFGVAANANGSNSGDSSGDEIFEWVYGCEGRTFYYDSDGDGFGRNNYPPLLGCSDAPPQNYVSEAGDCNDFNEDIYPGAEEYCNGRDDDCDGATDEDALPVTLWPDLDGDGYYARAEGESIVGCAGIEGYAAFSGDCKATDGNVHPDAEEICNYVDDNCDGRIDERVRPTCGVGWCRRASATCQPADCVPGDPRPEECNAFDDDCDGDIDNGDVCPASMFCKDGECVALQLPESNGNSTEDEQDSRSTGTAAGGCALRSLGEPATFGLLMLLFSVTLLRRNLRSNTTELFSRRG